MSGHSNSKISHFTIDPFTEVLIFEMTHFRSDAFSMWSISKLTNSEVNNFRTDRDSFQKSLEVTDFPCGLFLKCFFAEATHFRSEPFDYFEVTPFRSDSFRCDQVYQNDPFSEMFFSLWQPFFEVLIKNIIFFILKSRGLKMNVKISWFVSAGIRSLLRKLFVLKRAK